MRATRSVVASIVKLTVSLLIDVHMMLKVVIVQFLVGGLRV